MQKFVIAVIAAVLASPAFAAEQAIKLKQALGVHKVEANCQACHTLAYIPMNSPFLKPSVWGAEVTKMIKVFGALIDDADAKAIADYLKANTAADRRRPKSTQKPRRGFAAGLFLIVCLDNKP
jgi:mono/diheme cytochrome c family protein